MLRRDPESLPKPLSRAFSLAAVQKDHDAYDRQHANSKIEPPDHRVEHRSTVLISQPFDSGGNRGDATSSESNECHYQNNDQRFEVPETLFRSKKNKISHASESAIATQHWAQPAAHVLLTQSLES